MSESLSQTLVNLPQSYDGAAVVDGGQLRPEATISVLAVFLKSVGGSARFSEAEYDALADQFGVVIQDLDDGSRVVTLIEKEA